jgi:hypothetical protein
MKENITVTASELNAAIRRNKPQLVALDGIVIDAKYQRTYYKNAHPINKTEIDPDLFSAIHVSKFKGKVYGWEGQHRIVRAREAGITHLWGFVDERPTKDQAEMFVRMQKGRKPLKKWETFKGELAYGDPQAIAIARAIKKGGNMVVGGSGKTQVKAVGALEDVYAEYGEEALREVAAMITNLWPGESEAWAGTMWTGMALLLSQDTLTDKMQDNLRRCLPERILQRAGMVASEKSKAGFTSGQAMGKAPYVCAELLKEARKRR